MQLQVAGKSHKAKPCKKSPTVLTEELLEEICSINWAEDDWNKLKEMKHWKADDQNEWNKVWHVLVLLWNHGISSETCGDVSGLLYSSGVFSASCKSLVHECAYYLIELIRSLVCVSDSQITSWHYSDYITCTLVWGFCLLNYYYQCYWYTFYCILHLL